MLDRDAQYVFTNGHCHSFAEAVCRLTDGMLIQASATTEDGVDTHLLVRCGGRHLDAAGWAHADLDAEAATRKLEWEWDSLTVIAPGGWKASGDWFEPRVDDALPFAEALLRRLGVAINDKSAEAVATAQSASGGAGQVGGGSVAPAAPGVAGDQGAPAVEEVPFCGCANDALERGDTCGQESCPNLGLDQDERAVRRREFGVRRAVGKRTPKEREPLDVRERSALLLKEGEPALEWRVSLIASDSRTQEMVLVTAPTIERAERTASAFARFNDGVCVRYLVERVDICAEPGCERHLLSFDPRTARGVGATSEEEIENPERTRRCPKHGIAAGA